MPSVNTRRYAVALPPKSAPDVVKRVLTLSPAVPTEVGPSEFTQEFELGSDGAPSVEIRVVEGAEYTLSLVDTDNAGNASDASVRTFTALDQEAPPAPGGLEVAPVAGSEEIVEVP